MKRLLPVLEYGAAFIIIAALAIVLMDKVVMPIYVKHGERVILPDVRKMQYEEAAQMLGNRGFVPLKGDLQYNAEFDPGMIIEQQPSAHATVKTGRRVYLTVAIEEEFIEMPSLVGKSIRSAQLELSRVGLHADTLIHVFSDTFPEEVVTWQSVRQDGLIRRGSAVELKVSKGRNPNIYDVPDVVDMSLEEAKRRIAESRLTLGDIKYMQDMDLIPYTVLQQSVKPGTTLGEPQPVDLVVSVISLNDILNEQQRR